MSRRDRLATVVRVAELRETVARGQVAAAAATAVRARAEVTRRTDLLSGSRFDGSAVGVSVDRLSRRAAAVRAAEGEVARADAERVAAAHAHTDAARRTRLFGQLADRLRDEDEARRVAADQRAADDSTTARQSRRSPR